MESQRSSRQPIPGEQELKAVVLSLALDLSEALAHILEASEGVEGAESQRNNC